MRGLSLAMKLTINGKEKTVSEGTTIRALVVEQGFESLQVVVDHNGDLLEDKDLDRALEEGDTLRILPMVAGG